MRLSKGLSAFLLLILLSQSLFLGSGLLGVCLENQSKICKCNHGSRKEVHSSHKDDSLFSAKQKRIPTKSASNSSYEEEISANCHTAKAGEQHTCSCKKKKDSLARLSIYHQVWISCFYSHLSLDISDWEKVSPFAAGSLADGWNGKLIKPPRFSTI